MKDDTVYLRHILDAIGKTAEYVRGRTYEKFAENTMMIDAVVRELTIIGEAAAHVSDTFREQQSRDFFSRNDRHAQSNHARVFCC